MNPYRVQSSFNAGELNLLEAREDLAKFHTGLSIMENAIPTPQGGAEKRPGTKFIAEVKTSSLKTRLLPFEFSTSQSYIIEVGNQYMRFFTNGAPVLDGVGTEDISGLDNVVAHWLMNEASGTVVTDDDGGTHNGTASIDTLTLHADGKVGSGSFDLDGQYDVVVADSDDFSFTNNSDDIAFSVTCWAFVAQQDDIQVLLSKWRDDNTTQEWRMSLSMERKLQLHLKDTQSDLTSSRVAQWLLNDDAATKVILEVGTTHPATLQVNNSQDINETGIINGAIDFGGTDAAVVDADSAALSFDDSGTNPFSIAGWIFVTDAAVGQIILSKWDAGGNSEWMLILNGDEQLEFFLYDQSASAQITIATDDAISTGWHFVSATYDSTGGANAETGITMYVDSVSKSFSTGKVGTYVAMEDTATKVVIGGFFLTGSVARQFADKLDNIMLFDVELTQANIDTLYNSGSGTESMPTAIVSSVSDDAVPLGWHLLTVTYSAPANSTTAADGIILYVDSVAVNSTATNDSDYIAMQNGAEEVRIGSQRNTGDSANEKFLADKIDEVSVFSDVITPTEIASLFSTVPLEIACPYLTADLFNLKYEQSADVLYITHPDYETRKLSRLANALWIIPVTGIESGPFRTQNSDVADFISSSGTTGSVTLTATGHSPFVQGSVSGHEPSGANDTDKSNTGALFKLVHPLDTLSFSDTLEDDIGASSTEGVSWMACGTLYKGATWSWVTDGTWLGQVAVQRNYTIGAAFADAGWETVLPFDGVTTARNVTESGSEDDGDADYRVAFLDDTSGTVISYFTTDQTEVIGIVEITSVTSSTVAIGTVVKTIGSTDATYKWSEGSWSNFRGWPQTSSFFEDRLMFGGNTAQPDTIWGSVTSQYDDMTAGADDSDAVIFTLSSRQVNVIEWMVGKDKLLIGTSGAEWTIAGGTDEPLTPSNVIAKQHSTYGSANLQANLANESVLFFQRGAEKMRELAYNWELDSYVAPDMTILANAVTNTGITDTAFQRTPNSILWTTRTDGEMPIFSYERAENITAWSRMITQTNLAGTLTDSDIESVAVINGSPEDEVWVIVERTIGGSTVRYVEQFQPRDFGDSTDAFFVDAGVTYDSTASSTMTGLDHLNGQTVHVLADGVEFDTEVVAGGAITLSLDNVTTTASTVQMGLVYEVQLRTMPLSFVGGQTIQGKIKKISEVISRWHKSGDFSIGKNIDNLQVYSITNQTSDIDKKTFSPGWDRNGFVFVYQKSPEPFTLQSIGIEFNLR